MTEETLSEALPATSSRYDWYKHIKSSSQAAAWMTALFENQVLVDISVNQSEVDKTVKDFSRIGVTIDTHGAQWLLFACCEMDWASLFFSVLDSVSALDLIVDGIRNGIYTNLPDTARRLHDWEPPP